MPNTQKPDRSDCPTTIERRRQPRDGIDCMDWETKVLKRMEERLQAIMRDQQHGHEAEIDLGWEQAGLLALKDHATNFGSR